MTSRIQRGQRNNETPVGNKGGTLKISPSGQLFPLLDKEMWGKVMSSNRGGGCLEMLVSVYGTLDSRKTPSCCSSNLSGQVRQREMPLIYLAITLWCFLSGQSQLEANSGSLKNGDPATSNESRSKGAPRSKHRRASRPRIRSCQLPPKNDILTKGNT